jgi:hypothetical protein
LLANAISNDSAGLNRHFDGSSKLMASSHRISVSSQETFFACDFDSEGLAIGYTSLAPWWWWEAHIIHVQKRSHPPWLHLPSLLASVSSVGCSTARPSIHCRFLARRDRIGLRGPGALAGYSATSMLFGLASMSEDRREAFSILGAIAIGAIAWQRLAATPPSANDSDQRRPAQAWGQAHSTAHWIRAADLSGGRCKFERHRLMRIKIERYGRPSLERFARRANPHSPSRPTVLMRSASCGTRGERPKPDAQGDASPSPHCPWRQPRYSPILLGNSLSREAHPFTSTMARP